LIRKVAEMREGLFAGAALPLAALLVICTAGSTGQDLNQSFSAEGAVNRLQSLPLDSTKRSLLQSAIRGRDYARAESLLAAEAVRHPTSPSLLVFLADLLFLDGRQLNTVLVLKKAELLGPLDERSRFVLALSYISLGRKNLAIPELQQLARSNPGKAVYPYWLSRLMYRKMDLEHALSYAEQAVRLDPAFAKAYDQLGLCYAGLGRNDEAIRTYQNAIRLNEAQSLTSPWPSMNLGTLYMRLDRLKEAEITLRKSITVERRFPVSHFRLGQVLEKEGRRKEAVQELIEASRLDPTYPEPHYALARIFRRQDDHKSAAEQLSQFQKLRDADKQKGIVRPD
jgi:tetratricopeptide (TPR) repeat protein